MREPQSAPLPVREILVAITLIGVALVVAAGARGPRALAGFSMFCVGMAALDGLWRSAFGFRQASLLLGIFAIGLGFWSAAATGLLIVMDLRVPSVMRTLLVVSAACAAGSAAAALLAVRSPAWMSWSAVAGWLGSLRRSARPLGDPPRPDRPLRDRPVDAGPPLQPAGPVREG